MSAATVPHGKKASLKACIFCISIMRADLAKCPSCGQWNPENARPKTEKSGVVRFSDVEDKPLEVVKTGLADDVFSLAGGVVTTAVHLIGGDPGVGKSTLCLQLASLISEKRDGRDVLYVGLEESREETVARARRLKLPNLRALLLYPIGCDDDLGSVFTTHKPAAVIIDSIVKLSGGDVQAAVSTCAALKKFAIELNAPIFVIDHVTKELALAGLKALEHEVDWTGIFSPVEDAKRSKKHWIRELQSHKNRNGPAPEIAEFEMTGTGLVQIERAEEEEEEEGEGDDE